MLMFRCGSFYGRNPLEYFRGLVRSGDEPTFLTTDDLVKRFFLRSRLW